MAEQAQSVAGRRVTRGTPLPPVKRAVPFARRARWCAGLSELLLAELPRVFAGSSASVSLPFSARGGFFLICLPGLLICA